MNELAHPVEENDFTWSKTDEDRQVRGRGLLGLPLGDIERRLFSFRLIKEENESDCESSYVIKRPDSSTRISQKLINTEDEFGKCDESSPINLAHIERPADRILIQLLMRHQNKEINDF